MASFLYPQNLSQLETDCLRLTFCLFLQYNLQSDLTIAIIYFVNFEIKAIV